MKRDEMLKIEGYFEFFLIITFLLLFFMLIKSYIFSLFFASALVFLTYPVYTFIKQYVKFESLSAIIIILLVTMIIIMPVYLLSVTLINQSQIFIDGGQHVINNVDLSWCEYEECRKIEENVHLASIRVDDLIGVLGDFLSNSSVWIFSSLTTFAINILIFFLAFFFFLKDGEKFLRYVKRIIPMKEEYKHTLFTRFREASMAVFTNNILVAIIQGTLTGIGFWVFGLSNALFWGIVASFFALVPYIGPSIIWWPGVIYLLLTGDYFSGFGLMFFGILVVGLSDNIARPLLLRDAVKVHPFLIMLSILGGIEVLGFLMGLFVGPIIVSFLVTILDIYKLDFK